MSRSKTLFEKALKLFPGGVNSPVRAAFKPYPFFIERGEGAYVYTVDGQRYIDLILGYGPLVLGHRHPYVYKKVLEQIERGWLYAAPYEAELELAEKILGHVYPNGMVRFVNSGSEATSLAIRIARGYTGRKYIVKFEGCYHGAYDYVLVSAGSAAEHFGVPTSLGIPDEISRLTLVARYNHREDVEKIFSEYGDDIAAVIVEPVIGNMGVIPPKKGFLEYLRRVTSEYDSLLIFDEVITGFRLSLGGAQEYYGIKADLVTLGKIIGGGFPIGAVAGAKEIMENITPKGKIFNAGTFNSHPISIVAGLATIEYIEENKVLEKLATSAEEIEKVSKEVSEEIDLNIWVNRVESLIQIFFSEGPIWTVEEAKKSDKEMYFNFHRELLNRGVMVTPSQFEALFLSSEHKEEILDTVLQSISESIKALGG